MDDLSDLQRPVAEIRKSNSVCNLQLYGHKSLRQVAYHQHLVVVETCT